MFVCINIHTIEPKNPKSIIINIENMYIWLARRAHSSHAMCKEGSVFRRTQMNTLHATRQKETQTGLCVAPH
jgi:hypothetical protein